MQDFFDSLLFYSVGIVVAVLCAIAFYVNVVIPFNEERRYIKAELRRAASSSEYIYWKRELRRLYIKSIPLIGWLFIR